MQRHHRHPVQRGTIARARPVVSVGLLLLLLGLVAGIGAPQVGAQSKDVVVERRDGDITILANGDVQVAETWQVRFEGGPFHFAFRDFDMSRIENITAVTVGEGAQTFTQATTQAPNTFALAPGDRHLKVTWYFDETSNRVRTFQLHYTLHGVIRQYPGGDQFWWQFIEGDRGYVILESHVVQHLPAPVAADQLKIESYPGKATRVDDRTVTFDGESFTSYATFLVRTQFPHGLITAAAPAWQAADDAEREKYAQAAAQKAQADAQKAQADAQAQAELKAATDVVHFQQLAGGVIVLIGGLLGALVFFFLFVRQTPVALSSEFLNAPPDALSPGMAGALLDGHADVQDLLATLVDLARRGFLHVAVKQGDRSFDRVQGGDARTLRPYEQTLLTTLFGSRHKRTLTNPSDVQALRKYLPDFERAVQTALVQEGYFSAASRSASGVRQVVTNRVVSQLLGLVGVLVVMFGLFVLLRGGLSLYAVFDVVAVLVVVGAFVWVLRHKPPTTARGVQAAAKWQAFKRYLQNIQKYTAVAQAATQLENYLPYAVAFGIEREWLAAFAAVETPAPAWYQPDPLPARETASPDSYTRPAHEPASSGSHARPAHEPAPTTTGSFELPTVPSLNQVADNSFRGLNNMSLSFLGMLDGAASALSAPAESERHTRSSDRSSDSSSSWSSSDSSSSSSSSDWSGGGSSDSGGASGGGSSGFG